MRASPVFAAAFVFIAATFAIVAFADCPGNLDDDIVTPTYSYEVQYTNDNTDPDFISDADAQDAADSLDASHQAFVNLGFMAPFFVSDLEICIFDSSNAGGANFCRITLDSPSLSGQGEPCIRLVSGHELFHHVQYAYINNGSTSCGGCSGTWGQWTCEGTARLMQDKIFDDLDKDAGCITYIDEINSFLANPNNTLMNAEYKAALFWNYLTEQLGAVTTEPQRGVDVIETFWNNTDPTSPDPVQALRDTIGDFAGSTSLEDIFHDFTIANYTKELDLSSITDADKYFYIDETTSGVTGPAGFDPTDYDPVTRTLTAFSNSLSSSNVLRFAARYFEVAVDVETACDIIGFRGEADDSALDLGWTVLGIKGPSAPGGKNRLVELHKGRGNAFYKAFLNDPADPFVRLASVVTGLEDGGSFDFAFARDFLNEKTLQILRPTLTRQAYVGEHADPDRFQVRLTVQGPDILTPDGTGTISVKGLSKDEFTVYVENASASEEAEILSAAYVGGQYWLVVQAPEMDPSDGALFNVRVCICESGGDCSVSTTSSNSVVYAKIVRNQQLVIDRSGSMLSPSATPKIVAAKAAATLFVDSAGEDDRLGVISFTGDGPPDGNECDEDSASEHDLQLVSGNRATAKTRIGNISAGGWTAIGDGLNRAQDQIESLGGPADVNHIVLLSDGMENEAACWRTSSTCSNFCPNTSTTVPDVRVRFGAGGSASGTVIDAIAFGPQTDQTLMQDIATTTDGDYFYVDTSDVSGALLPASGAFSPAAVTPSSLAVGNRISNTYLLVGEKIQRKQRLFSAAGSISSGETRTVDIAVTENGVEGAVFSFNWENPEAVSEVLLRDPSGAVVDASSASIFRNETHTVYQLPKPIASGTWRAEISAKTSTQYLAVLSGRLIRGVGAQLYFGQVPGSFAGVFGSRFLAGLPVTILLSLVDEKGPVRADVTAAVAAPDGSEINLPLFDDGKHDDGDANDGIYGNIYTRTAGFSNQGVPEDEEEKDPGTRGSYVVTVLARGVSNAGERFERSLNRAFQVYEFFLEINPDQDKDDLPDRWEAIYGTMLQLFDRNEDYDNDDLPNIEELRQGTRPLDPDTDGGGELDGSEVRRGANPLDPDDDLLPRPMDVEVVTTEGNELPENIPFKPNTNIIRYPANPAYRLLILYRGTTPAALTRAADIDPQKAELPGIYPDENLTSGQTYYYQIQALGQGEATSALSPVFSGTPREDVMAPRGWVIINNGALTTDLLDVVLTLDPAPDNFEVMISNDPAFGDAKWIPNPGETQWTLEITGQEGRATVYARFRDKAGNESITYHDSIFVKTEPSDLKRYIDGIYKPDDDSMNAFVQTYSTGSILIILTPDLKKWFVFLDEAWSDDTRAVPDLAGEGHFLNLKFTSRLEAIGTLTEAEEKPRTWIFRKQFGLPEALTGMSGIFKPADNSTSAYIQFYETGSALVILTPDLKNWLVFLDPNWSDGIELDNDLGQTEHKFSLKFADAESAEAVLVYPTGASRTWGFVKNFKAPDPAQVE